MAQSGTVPKQFIRHDAAAVDITSAAYIELDAALDGNTNEIEIYNTTTQILILAQGPAGSEDDMFFIPAAGNLRMRLKLDIDARLAVRALGTSATAGDLLINLWG